MSRESLEAGAAKAGVVVMTTAAAVSPPSAWYFSSDMVAWYGLGITVIGFLVNWYYRRKADKRAEKLFQARLNGEIE